MNKAAFVTVAVMYLFGFLGYVIVFLISVWDRTGSFMPYAAEAVRRGLIWPYLLYEWLRFDVPLL